MNARGLTRRELEVARLVASGHSNKMIGRLLELSVGTIKVHLHNIFVKLELINRIELAMVVSDIEREERSDVLLRQD